MLRNYLAAALRNLARNRLYAAINIIGLAVGFAAALLIALFVRDELTYDRWIPGHENIYRVSTSTMIAGTKQEQDITLFGVAEALRQDFPDIAAIAQLSCCEDLSGLRNGDIESMEPFRWADANLFDVLPLPTVAGDLRVALAEPNSIVLTRSLARKYFGTDTPIGRTVEVSRKHLMRVTAVLEDLPSDTHLDIGAVASISTLSAEVARREIDASHVYIRLAPGVSADRLREALPAFNERHPEFTKVRAAYWLDAVVPIADIHLRPASHLAMKPSGNMATITGAIAIALLIVAVASINFVNLTTARAVRRAVEVGVRKASGALRRQLIAQFIGEALIYAVLGMAAAIALAALMLPAFNAFLQRTITLDLANDPILSGAMIVILAFVGGAAGAYPALMLSRIAPAAVLKGGVQARKAKSKGRQLLVAAQFAVLIVLALVATAITRQARYTSSEALRLDTDQIVVVNGGLQGACGPALMTAVRALSGVQGATCVAGPILGAPGVNMEVEAPSGTKAKSQMLPIDFEMFDVYGLTPVAGRFFSPAYGGDAAPLDDKIDLGRSAVINEALARALGYVDPQAAIGTIIRFSPTIARTATEKRPDAVTEIVGVAPDFGASRNLRETVPPRVFFIEADTLEHGSLHIKLVGGKIPETLTAIDALWKNLGPPKPIQRVFLDQAIEEMYREYARLGETVGLFAAIAVFISCLGLFGLAAFAAEQRTKEIGVRKSMGASGADIVRMMLWDFSKPVLWGSLIAWPVGYLIMRRWLENFAERIDVGLWMFPLASLLALAIALLTVIGHALLVARAEPVKALRYE